MLAAGFEYVFDANFSADLTIMEEGTELLKRLRKKWGLELPAEPGMLFTVAAWTTLARTLSCTSYWAGNGVSMMQPCPSHAAVPFACQLPSS